MPFVEFKFSADENQLEAIINGYCNGTEATYKIFKNYLEVIQRGATTLSDCGGDEDLDYFFPIKGQITYTETTDKVFYEFTEDKKGISIWIDENHKLYFTQKVLSVAENSFEKSILLYPTPTKDIIHIDVKSASIVLSEISIIDFQGREVLKKSTDIKSIDISELSKGVYFLKILGANNVAITKKFMKK
ncbi:T9SS type A sorting domain-containing protein [Polaribacter sp. Hel_I_88]|uniref:T9SS type A sorting domain-containing protein n=1 Tax=Polaribacter sp. Hel_I_88 TaxID=1250006 RepID=UPI0009DDBD52